MIDGKITRYDCSWFYLGKSHFCPGCMMPFGVCNYGTDTSISFEAE